MAISFLSSQTKERNFELLKGEHCSHRLFGTSELEIFLHVHVCLGVYVYLRYYTIYLIIINI